MNSLGWNFAPFHMEAPLESGRFASRWNGGESGGPAQTLGSLLNTHATANNIASSELFDELAQISLADSPNHGRADLRAHVARLHAGARMENVLITTGTSEALLLLFLALRPQKVAVVLPGFQLLSELVTASGAELVALPMRWDEKAHPVTDCDEWLAMIRAQRPDLILLNHPHNPSGAVFSQPFLRELQDYLDSSGANIIGDEHYRFLSSGGELGPTIYRQGEPDTRGTSSTQAKTSSWRATRMVTGSFIKCLGTPGLRIGWCLAPESLISHIQNIKNYTTHTVNPLSEWVAERILRNPNLDDFSSMRGIWRQNCIQLEQWSQQQHGWLVRPPDGGWVTCLTHHDFPRAKPAVSQKLRKAECFLLDLAHLEFERFGVSGCSMTTRGGYRLGLGMAPAAFGEMLAFLGDLQV